MGAFLGVDGVEISLSSEDTRKVSAAVAYEVNELARDSALDGNSCADRSDGELVVSIVSGE